MGANDWEVLVTLFAEVCAIVNSRPLVQVSCDPEVHDLLTPSTLLTYTDINGNVQSIWLMCFGPNGRAFSLVKTWTEDRLNLREGDVVLVKDKESVRMDWPVGRVDQVFASDDGKVCTVKVAIVKDDKPNYYIRPIVNTVLLVAKD